MRPIHTYKVSKIAVFSLFFAFFVLVNSASAQLLGGGNLAVARVGKEEITKGRVDSLATMLAMQQFRGQQVPPDMMAQVRTTVMDNLIGQKLLAMEAKKLGIKVSEKKVDSLVTLFKSQFPSEQVFQQELAKSGSDMNQFRQKIVDQVRSDMLLEQKVPYPSEPTDAEVKKYFQDNKSKVAISDTISGAQIFLRVDKGENAQSIDDKKKILEGLAAQVRAEKASFAMLAAQYSDDPKAKENGGLVGRFVAKDFGPEFAKAVAGLKVGEISKPFVTKTGVHIFMLTEKNDGKLDSYKHRVKMILGMEREQQRQMKAKEYLEKLAKVYGVVTLNPEYKTSLGVK